MLAVPIKMYLSRYIYIYIYIYVNCITYICFNFVISRVKKKKLLFCTTSILLRKFAVCPSVWLGDITESIVISLVLMLIFDFISDLNSDCHVVTYPKKIKLLLCCGGCCFGSSTIIFHVYKLYRCLKCFTSWTLTDLLMAT